MQGFIILDDYAHCYGEFFTQMGQWLQAGRIRYRESIIDGLEQAPEGLTGLLQGQNVGTLIVRV